MDFKKYNNRQMQVYAALCLRKFCRAFRITHPAIEELVTHLLDLATVIDLAKWDELGRNLLVTGRGDELPQEVAERVPAEFLSTFNSLVECSVEVGIVDLYGASTHLPGVFLQRCVEILNKNSVELPDEGVLQLFAISPGGWGLPVDRAKWSQFTKSLD